MITSFQVESLGVEFPCYFTGYGLGPSSTFSHCCYGIGDTESEALDDCLEQLAQETALDPETEARIKAAYGSADDTKTAADALGIDEDGDEDGEGPYFHVGIKWNEG
jgi:hypothetical protein